MSYCNTSSASFVCMSPDRPSDNAYHPYNTNALCVMHYVCIFSAPMSGSSKVHALRHICIVTICNMNISTVVTYDSTFQFVENSRPPPTLAVRHNPEKASFTVVKSKIKILRVLNNLGDRQKERRQPVTR